MKKKFSHPRLKGVAIGLKFKHKALVQEDIFDMVWQESFCAVCYMCSDMICSLIYLLCKCDMTRCYAATKHCGGCDMKIEI